jgi:GTP-binding protein
MKSARQSTLARQRQFTFARAIRAIGATRLVPSSLRRLFHSSLSREAKPPRHPKILSNASASPFSAPAHIDFFTKRSQPARFKFQVFKFYASLPSQFAQRMPATPGLGVRCPRTALQPSRIAKSSTRPSNGVMKSMPAVAIVGRPNVGKSSLLNALVGKRISIVQDMPGVTRDRISMPLYIDGKFVELVDTGGYGFIDPDLTEHIKHQIELAMARAQAVIFIVDVQAGLTSADQEIAAMLRQKGLRTILVANKTDGPSWDASLGDFARLGLGTPIGVSAANVRNLDEVRSAIERTIDLSKAPTKIPEPEMMVAIVGKRNAGKSTMVNSIAELYEGPGEKDRVIVSEVPGTTRDSVDVRFEKDGRSLVVIDTAGVRKKRHMVTNDIEFYSFHRAQRSVRRADVVMLLLDATEPISEPDKKLAQYIAEEFKPVLLVINKWDLAKQVLREKKKKGQEDVDERAAMEKYREYIDAELPFLNYAPIAFVTAKDGRNVQAALDQTQHLFNQSRQRMTTGRLNQVIRSILQERAPSTPFGRKAKVFFATQIDTAPPTIVLVVNNPDFIDDSYQRHIINRLRDLLPYPEVPIRLLIRPRGQRTNEAALDELNEEDVKEAGVGKGTGAKARTKTRAKGGSRGSAPGAAVRGGGVKRGGKRERAADKRR